MRKLARLIGTAHRPDHVALALPPAAHVVPGANGDIVYDRFFKGGSEIFSIDPAHREVRRG